jgi:hypothetical protein
LLIGPICKLRKKLNVFNMVPETIFTTISWSVYYWHAFPA